MSSASNNMKKKAPIVDAANEKPAADEQTIQELRRLKWRNIRKRKKIALEKKKAEAVRLQEENKVLKEEKARLEQIYAQAVIAINEENSRALLRGTCAELMKLTYVPPTRAGLPQVVPGFSLNSQILQQFGMSTTELPQAIPVANSRVALTQQQRDTGGDLEALRALVNEKKISVLRNWYRSLQSVPAAKPIVTSLPAGVASLPTGVASLPAVGSADPQLVQLLLNSAPLPPQVRPGFPY